MQRFMTAYFLGLDEIKVYTEEEYRKKEIEIATCDDWVWQWAKDKETAKKQHFNKYVGRRAQKMEFKLQFNMDNAAFKDDEGDDNQMPEIFRILEQVMDDLKWTDSNAIVDLNGAKIGKYEITT